MEGLRWILLLLGALLIGAVYWAGRRGDDPTRESLFERASRAAERGDDEAEAASGTGDAPDLDVSAGRPGEPPAEPGEPAAPTDPVESDADAAQASVGEAVAPKAERDSDWGAATDADATAAEPGEPVVEPAAHEAPPRGEPGAETSTRGAADESNMVVLFLVAAEGERLVGARLAEAFARHGLEHGEQGIFHARDGDGTTVFSVANAVEPGTFDPSTMDTLSTPGLVLVLRLPGPQWAETAFDRMVTTARMLADELGARVLDGSRSTLTRQTEQHLRDDLRAFDLRRSRGPL
jgi:cell division protein ZipA